MKVLHYALGFPPYRSGGLTRYVIDVAEEQSRQNIEVSMLWPGRISRSHKHIYIRKHQNYKQIINSYELCNALPVVLDRQVSDPEAFICSTNEEYYISFLKKIMPDVIHIHTLQGIHQEFINAARYLNIPTVFTTHDFFGLYPMNAVYPMDHNLSDYECSVINKNAPSIRYLNLMQSPIVRYAKSSIFLRNFFSRIRNQKKQIDQSDNLVNVKVKPYHIFRQYIIDLIEQIDCILYNSTVAKSAYERYCQPRASMFLSITHSNLPQKRQYSWKNDRLNIAYVGGDRPYKGLDFLLEAFKQLEKSKYQLNIYGVAGKNTNNILYHAKYNNFEEAMRKTDLLVVPSLTYESFGFVVLESISYGLPVIISDVVGAKDLFLGHEEYIFKNGDISDLICHLSQPITSYNPINIDDNFDIIQHCQRLKEIYQLYIEGKHDII